MIFIGLPPERTVLRAMAIHKTPELVGEVLQCCPKHVDEQKRKCETVTINSYCMK